MNNGSEYIFDEAAAEEITQAIERDARRYDKAYSEEDEVRLR